MANAYRIIRQHTALSLSLFLRYGAVLTAIWAAGILLNRILLHIAVEMGIMNRLLGLVAIAPVVLLQLLVVVAMFVILHNGLPHLRRPTRPQPTAMTATDKDSDGGVFAVALLAVLIPFYGYYAGWGLLGDTLRNYSQIFYATQMSRIDFSNPEFPATALEIGQTGWVIFAVVLIWAIRRGAKARHGSNKTGFWALLVVACEATWALLGLYVLSGWKNTLAAWLASYPSPADLIGQIIPAAGAAITDAVTRPVDWPTAPQPVETLNALFRYALLPLIWFNLGAIVYGHDMQSVRPETRRIAGTAMRRWQMLPKPLTDFIGHFWMGVVRRWHAVANGVLLAASAGVALTASVLVLWRLVDWLGNWAWVGLAHLIGPQDMQTWQLLAVPLNLAFGAPGAPPGGLLVSPLQFCILAAGLDLAGRASANPKGAAATAA